MPGRMFKRCIQISPATGIIYQDHKCHCCTTENIKGVEAFLQADTFIGKDKEPVNRKQDIGALKKENNPYCVMQFFARVS